jgi:hypothetical protein
MKMKIIDKTNGNSKEWGYGTVLKCWDSDPKMFNLFKISRAEASDRDSYRLDILHDQSTNEDMVWGKKYSDISSLKHDLSEYFHHVMRVKVTIIIKNFEGEQNEDQD